MSILQLPEELIQKILRYLDRKSIASFGRTHPKIQDAVDAISDSMKVEVLSEDILKSIVFSNHIRSLDLSNCSAPQYLLRDAILKFPNLAHLSVVNTRITYWCLWDVLGHLTRLVSLSFTMLTEMSRSKDRTIAKQALSTMTCLCIEVRPTDWSLEFLIEMLNECKPIRWFNVNVIGREKSSPVESSSAVQLRQIRWLTLRTVVVSVIMSDSEIFHRRLLRRIFAPFLDQRLEDWIFEDKPCYIYEKGYINEAMMSTPPTGASTEWLGKILDADVSNWKINLPPPEIFSRASPRELSLNMVKWGVYSLHSGYPILKNLVEVDLSELHWVGGAIFCALRLQNLEVLALAACLLNFYQFDFSPLKKLRKLWLRGKIDAPSRWRGIRNGEPACERCSNPFFSHRPDYLTCLETLEELTIDEVILETDVFLDWGQLQAHTVRLNIPDELDSRTLHSLTRRLPNLRNFKVRAPVIDLNFPRFSSAFLGAKKLKQLCLESTRGFSVTSSTIQKWLDGILPRLETLHLHAPFFRVRGTYNDISQLPALKKYQHKIIGPEYGSMDSVNVAEIPQVMPGRCLCFSGTLIGRVKLDGWKRDRKP